MPVATGTATDHDDLFTRLRAFLVDTDPDGPEWTELDYDGGTNTALFEAPGLSGTEEIHIGFGVEESDTDDAYALRGWMFQDYNPALAHLVQPGHSGVKYHPVWDTSIPYWFIANGQCVKIVTKISTVYTASYLGKFLSYGTPSEYPQPYYLGMPRDSNIRWSNTSHNFRNFFDPTNALMLLPASAWNGVSNFFDLSGTDSVSGGPSFIWPYATNIGNFAVNSVINRYRNLRNNVDGSYHLFPLVLTSDAPTDDIFGELDGAYAVPGFSAASEDIIEIGSDDYLIIQNTFQADRYHYAALKLV